MINLLIVVNFTESGTLLATVTESVNLVNSTYAVEINKEPLLKKAIDRSIRILQREYDRNKKLS